MVSASPAAGDWCPVCPWLCPSSSPAPAPPGTAGSRECRPRCIGMHADPGRGLPRARVQRSWTHVRLLRLEPNRAGFVADGGSGITCPSHPPFAPLRCSLGSGAGGDHAPVWAGESRPGRLERPSPALETGGAGGSGDGRPGSCLQCSSSAAGARPCPECPMPSCSGLRSALGRSRRCWLRLVRLQGGQGPGGALAHQGSPEVAVGAALMGAPLMGCPARVGGHGGLGGAGSAMFCGSCGRSWHEWQ